MSVGPASPLATWDWVKPFGTVPWAGLMANASKVPTAASKVSVIAASGRRALLTPISPSFLSWAGEKVVVPGLVAGRTLARWYEHFSLHLPFNGTGLLSRPALLLNANTVASTKY
jgi:hypothetical protein